MNLAICIFCCRDCHKALDSKEALAHPCATAYKIQEDGFPKDFDIQLQAFSNYAEELPWNMNGSISFRPKYSDAAAKVLALLKSDPATATPEDLDRAFDIFECKECLSFSSGSLMLDWRGAAEHLPEKAGEGVSESARERMEEMAVKRRAAPPSKNPLDGGDRAGQSPPLVCSHCLRRCHRHTARIHLLEKHGIADPPDDDMTVLVSEKRHSPYRDWRFDKVSTY